MSLKQLSPLIGGLMITAALGLSSLNNLGSSPQVRVDPNRPAVIINQHQIEVEIADEETEQVKGLSGRPSLGPDNGMLFIFESPDYHGIWMKDMQFSLDILWLDENRQIIAIAKGITPETYPQTLKPSYPAKYVLEVNAGVAEKYGWSAGQTADLKLP